MKSQIRKLIRHAKFSVRIGGFLLLLIYTAVFLYSPGMIRHTEHDHVKHQRDTCDKDPCHIAIYHPGQKGSCNHKFHFTKTPDKCPWCDVILVHQLNASEALFPSQPVSSFDLEIEIIDDQSIQFSFPLSDRGPPVSFHI